MPLSEFFRSHRRCALAFSGGVDSAYLLWAGQRAGARLQPYFVRTAFQPAFELEDARRLCGQLGLELRVLELDILAQPLVARNGPDRCYHCKKQIFGAIAAAAAREGYPVVLDGSNASDSPLQRPGMRALEELQVRSPLREAGLDKAAIRELSRRAGLFTHDKPAYACLATRIPTGQALRAEDLQRTERAEGALARLGFRDFRLRLYGGAARLQLPESQLPLLLQLRRQVLEALNKDYPAVLLDLEVRP